MNAMDEFLAEARDVSLRFAAELYGVVIKGKGPEHTGPCPVCGGRDRFAIHFQKGLWHCRGADRGGDALALVAYVEDLDLKTRAGLLQAASLLLQRPVPEDGATETEAEREHRRQRLAERAFRQKEAALQQAQQGEEHRQKAIRRAAGTFAKAQIIDPNPGSGSRIVADYLRARTGFLMPPPVLQALRFEPRHTFWHGRDERGSAQALHCGPAMIAAFSDLTGAVSGCHETWIDMAVQAKCRPKLRDPQTGDALPSKKMQGAVKGALIALCGSMQSRRWVAGEGIETVLAIAGAEQFRSDTFYCATGSIGNLAGPADPASHFFHPTATKTVRRAGRDGAEASQYQRGLTLAGPVPLQGSIRQAFPVAAHVTLLVLLADGDSEFIWTASAMARAEARFAATGRDVQVWWPPKGQDFADALKGAA